MSSASLLLLLLPTQHLGFIRSQERQVSVILTVGCRDQPRGIVIQEIAITDQICRFAAGGKQGGGVGVGGGERSSRTDECVTTTIVIEGVVGVSVVVVDTVDVKIEGIIIVGLVVMLLLRRLETTEIDQLARLWWWWWQW